MDNSKKILLVGPAYPYRGGLAAFNESLAYALQAAGHQVELITFTLQYPGFLFPGKTQYSDDPAPEDLVIHRKINSVNPFNWLTVGWELRQQYADVIITAFWLPFMGPSLGSILRFVSSAKTRRIGLIHNIIPHESRPGDRLFSRYFTSASDAFMTLSSSVAKELKEFSQAPVRTSPHPVYDSYGDPVSKEEARAKLRLESDAQYLLFFGFIREYKGLDLLLEALADERLRAANVQLILAGEYYGNEAKYEALIDEFGIRDRVVSHTRFVSNEEIRYFFGAADLVVQPYRTATQSGISQLAYHFEKPMIVTRVGGLPEIVPHGRAGYVIDQDPGELANAVIDFYQNEREQDFQAGLREQKGRFSWAGFVEVLEELFPA